MILYILLVNSLIGLVFSLFFSIYTKKYKEIKYFSILILSSLVFGYLSCFVTVFMLIKQMDSLVGIINLERGKNIILENKLKLN